MGLSNCTIEVSFFEAPNQGFAYFCVNHSPPWQVTLDGTICPPLRSRVIELNPKNPSTLKFAGIRIAPDRATLLNLPGSQVYLNDSDIQTTPNSASGFPSPTIVLEDPMPSATKPPLPIRLYYSLGVQLTKDGTTTVHWDDPKIYNPGDD